MERRLKQLTEWLKEQDINVAFVNAPANIYYLTNFLTDPHERLLGLLLFQEQPPILICPNMEKGPIREVGWKHEILGYDDHEDPWEIIGQSLKERNLLNVTKLSIEKEYISYNRAEKLQELFPDAAISSLEEKINQVRMIKDNEEINKMREAAQLADFGVEVGVNAIQSGKTEIEIVATIEYELKKRGISGMSFSTMVLTGGKTAFPHGKPGLAKIKEGDLVLFDLGVIHNGYCSDITRTVAFKSITPEQEKIYQTVKAAQEAALTISKPGVRLGEIDTAARNVIKNNGYGDYFVHRIGHGLGIEVHEYPSMSENNNSSALKGMTYTIEPGIYIEGVGGVRIEDEVVLTENGCETLTNYPKELQIIE